MNNEYITKAQAIDLVKSLEVVLGCLGVSVLVREIERLPDCWVSPWDREPEEDKKVLVYRCGTFDVAEYYGLGMWQNWDGYCYKNKEVNGWMPLPEPPKEE